MIELALMVKGFGFAGACYGWFAQNSKLNSVIFFGSLGFILVGSLI